MGTDLSVDGIEKPIKVNMACKWVSHNALFLKSQKHSVNDSI